MPEQRISWVDIAKGLGIVAVVIGHNANYYKIYEISKYIYWFHMPLFFIISGLLFKQYSGFKQCFVQKFKHLMVPYFIFLLCCFVYKSMSGEISINMATIASFLAGGTQLSYFSGVFWFVSCLFLTQIAAYFMLQHARGRIVVYILICVYVAIMIITMRNTAFYYNRPVVQLSSLPFGLEIVPMALVYYTLGYFLRDMLLTEKHMPGIVNIFLISVAGLAVFLDMKNIVQFGWINMYGRQYGDMFVNILLPVLFFMVIRETAIMISRSSFSTRIFIVLGRASLVIMFLHMAMPSALCRIGKAVLGRDVETFVVRIGLGLVLPVVVYWLAMKFSLTRKLLIGQGKPLAAKK